MKPRRAIWTWLVIAGAASLLPVPASGETPGTARAPVPVPAPASTPTPAPGASLAEGHLDLDALRGQVVLVDFWASWCKPCLASFPWLSELQNEYADAGLVVIGVNEDRRRSEADTFLEANPPSFRIVFDAEGRVAERFKLQGMPSSFIFDRNGQRRSNHVGFRTSDRAELERLIQDLLSEPEANAS